MKTPPCDPAALRDILVSAAPPDLPLSFRAMFGGIMAYAEGKPFASLSDVGVGLKLRGDSLAECLAVPGAAMLRYAPDQPASKSYVLLPAAIVQDRKVLRGWIARSAADTAATPRRKKEPTR